MKNRVQNQQQSVFTRFGVRPVVNCCGVYTDLGGSILSPSVWEAIEELNQWFVRMPDLIDAASARIAELVRAEAARITPGASAALALAVGATMTGTTGRRWEQLPDTSGLKSDALIAASHLKDYKYAVCARMSGASLVPAGPENGYDEGALLDAITERTACILVPAHLLDGFDGTARLCSLASRARALGVPVVVDAAYLCDPVSLMTDFASAGADLTCFSAKYFGGPNSGGFVSGSRALIAAVEGLDFTRFESGQFKSFGRPFKMSRYDVAATALALSEWFAMDHSARWEGYARKVARLKDAVPEGSGLIAEPRLFTMDEQLLSSDRVNCLSISAGRSSAASVEAVSALLESGDPSIVGVMLADSLILAVDTLKDGQEELVAERLKQALATAGVGE